MLQALQIIGVTRCGVLRLRHIADQIRVGEVWPAGQRRHQQDQEAARLHHAPTGAQHIRVHSAVTIENDAAIFTAESLLCLFLWVRAARLRSVAQP